MNEATPEVSDNWAQVKSPTRMKDFTGRTFGRLKVLSLAPFREKPNGQRKTYWRCRCLCGVETEVWGGPLSSGKTRSCGCLKRETANSSTTHGQSYTSLYRTWSTMISRCHKPTATNYDRYGAKGVHVFPQWRSSFEAFSKSVGAPPSSEHTLDRFPERSGNYEPGNVRWATPMQQARNRRDNRLLTINGESKCVSEWAEISGTKDATIRSRLARGTDPKTAVFKRPR